MRRLLAVLLIVVACTSAKAASDNILFAPKAYFDDGKDAETVSFSGTMTGEGVGVPNNTYAVTCLRIPKECWISSVDQIATNHVSRMESPWRMDIVRWADREIIVRDEGMCSTTTMTISRSVKQIFWVQEPANQTRPYCAKSDTKTYKWTIEDSLGMRRMRANVPRN